MSFGLDFLGKIVTHRTYALTKQDGTKETLDEMADRIARLHTLKYRKQIYNHKDAYLFWYYLTRSRDLISRGILSPSMRSFNFAPEALLANNLRIFNCSSMQFQEKESGKKFHDLTQLSMCGCGIGVRVDGPVEIVPAAQKRNLYTIPDTREGWSKAVQLAVEYPDCKFDISLVRPKGSPISSGGYASGGEVLLDGLLKIQRVCKGKTVLSIEDVLDISAIILSFVQAGGSRRSAGIAIAPYFALKNYKSPENTANKQYRFYLNVSTYWDNLPDVKSALIDSLTTGEPGLVKYSMKSGICNACLSGEARLLSLTRGVITMNDLQIGEEIFDGEGWTNVLAKWSNGVRPTYKYHTTRGMFYGTDDHRVVENGVKVEVRDAKGIDWACPLPVIEKSSLHPQDIMDGVVLGDGSVHKASNNLVYLCVGKQDSDYFDSEIAHLFDRDRPALKGWEVSTTITAEELPRTWERRVPHRFLYGSVSKKRAFLRGLFTANGNFLKKQNRAALKASSLGLIRDVQYMLYTLGIDSYITTNKPTAIQHYNGVYSSKISYDLNIGAKESVVLFCETIGFIQKYKNHDPSWRRDIARRSASCSKITCVEPMGEQEVWDITVDNDKHVFWTDGCIVSNCGEITSEYDTLLCNLTEVNVAGMEEFGAFLDAVVCATFLGTLQAGFTKGIEELHESFAKNYDEERGLGVSLTGAMQNDERIERWLKPGSDTRDIVGQRMRDTNKWVADMLGFREAARITTGKPSGSNSARLGVTSGFNPAVITHGYRRVTIEKHHPLYQKIKEKDPNGIFLQDCVWNPDSSSKFCIPCHWENAKVLSAQEHADWIARMTESWIELGHNRGEYTNSISTTIHCREEDITDEFVESLRKIGNVTLLAKEDHVYPQAPFEQLPWEEFKKVEAEFIEMFKDFDFSSVVYDTHHVFEREAACSAGGCELK